MEGLLPYVLRALKRRRTRRSYQCLSMDRAERPPLHTQSLRHLPPSPARLEGSHRRHASMGDITYEDSSQRHY